MSVILTVYKRTTFLGEALNSVLTQTFRDFEVIVADDSGNAGSREIIERYPDSHIIFHPNPTTLGVVMSIRRAIARARGDFIIIINDDDIWEKDLLTELIMPMIADPALVVSFSDHWLMQEDGSLDETASESYSRQFRRAPLARGVIHDVAALAVVHHAVSINISAAFRKDALDLSLIFPQVTGAYDYWISCILAASGRPHYYVPRRLARWRMHSAMETHRQSPDKGENMVFIFSYLQEHNWFPQLSVALRRELAEAAIMVGRGKLRYDRTQEARRYFRLCFTQSQRLRALLLVLFSFLPRPARSSVRFLEEKALPYGKGAMTNSTFGPSQ